MTLMLFGGVLIGAAAGMLFLYEGRIAGVSGMLATLLSGGGSGLPFVVGLITAGAVAGAVAPGLLPPGYAASTSRLMTAGLLVGFGARLGNGCTSGHGLCGVARGSARSMVALATFMVLGAITVFIERTLQGG